MSDLLDLIFLKVTATEHKKGKYYFNVEMAEKPGVCPACGVVEPRVHLHGHNFQPFHDLLIHGDKVGILVNRMRYKCLECGQTFMEWLPDMDDKHRVTKRLLAYFQQHAVTDSYTNLANEVGVAEGVARHIFHEYFKERLSNYKVVTPKWLGVDEVHLQGRYRFILTNIEETCVIDLLTDRKKATVIDYLSHMPDKDKIEVVCMDMWDDYRQAVKIALPSAKIIIDKYHVVRDATKALDTQRKLVAKHIPKKRAKQEFKRSRKLLLSRNRKLDASGQWRLECWLCNEPTLKRVYELREEFQDIFDTATTREEAESRYAAWETTVKEKSVFYSLFKELVTHIKNWNTEIFNYFDMVQIKRLTNAKTENLNGVIRDLNRPGKGYDFDALRAKILLYSQAEKVVPELPTFKKEDFAIHNMMEYLATLDSQKRIYGIYLPTLLEYLDKES